MATGISYEGNTSRLGVSQAGVECVLMSSAGVRVQTTVSHGPIPGNPQFDSNGNVLEKGYYKFNNLTQGTYFIEFYGEGFTSADTIQIQVAGNPMDEQVPSVAQYDDYLSDFKHLTWGSRLLTDVMHPETALVRDLSANSADGKGLVVDEDNDYLWLGTDNPIPNSFYHYETLDMETQGSPTISGINVATLFANYSVGDTPIKIESSFDGGNSWFT